MTINATEIINAIGDGVAEALKTNTLFLGVEVGTFNNADIHPEYVITVEVAKRLAALDRRVSLETHMKELRRAAGGMAKLRSRSSGATLTDIEDILARYRFGKKDSQRLDILVRSSDGLLPPLLIAEAKLGVKNASGVIQDIDRVATLFSMYNDLQLLEQNNVYGAVLFHSMEEGNAVGTESQKAQDLLARLGVYLTDLRRRMPWLNAKAGLLTIGRKIQPVEGYKEIYPDGSSEDVFAKDSFTFAPGLVLVGNAQDVATATF